MAKCMDTLQNPLHATALYTLLPTWIYGSKLFGATRQAEVKVSQLQVGEIRQEASCSIADNYLAWSPVLMTSHRRSDAEN